MSPLQTDSAATAGADALVAWEAPRDANLEDRIAALTEIAARLGSASAGVAVPIDPPLAATVDQVVALAQRHRVRVLPIVRLDHPDATAAWERVQLPAAIAALGAAGVLYESAGLRYAVLATSAEGTHLDALPSLAAALSMHGHAVRIGWRRVASRYIATPTALDFALEYPPYHGSDAGAVQAPRVFPYPVLVAELAKRRAGDGLVTPSVLWSATRDTEVLDGRVKLTDFSPLKFAHALDGAARFVRNRRAECVPFWLLRAAFSPSQPAHLDALDTLAETLASEHRSSPTVGAVAGSIAIAARSARIAVVVHLYYPDLWPDLADTIANLPEPFDLYVSCPFRLLPAIRQQVAARFPNAAVFGVQNLGRDVLPFLLWLRAVGANAYVYVLKLHGKKSVHFMDADKMPFGGGDAWRRDAFSGLVGDRQHAQRMLAALDAAPAVGLVAPAGQLHDQVTWRCATTDLVVTLLARLGLDCEVRGSFPAGTMFWARMSALARFSALPDDLVDFEREAGQVDGTLHHAYERAFALVAASEGFSIADSGTLIA